MEQVIPGISGEFPAFGKRLQGYIEDSLHNAQARFPNLKLAYLSSRSYGGSPAGGGSPQPFAYETGFAAEWGGAAPSAGAPAPKYGPAAGKGVGSWDSPGPHLSG